MESANVAHRVSEKKEKFKETLQGVSNGGLYGELFGNDNGQWGALNRQDLLNVKKRLDSHKKNGQDFAVHIYGDTGLFKEIQGLLSPGGLHKELLSYNEDLFVYFYAFDNPEKQESLSHVEIIVKAKDNFIMPYTIAETVPNLFKLDRKNTLKEFKEKAFYPDITKFMKSPDKKICAQADEVSCGAYAYHYTKDLLFHNAKGLYSDSLCLKIKHTNQEGKIETWNFFVPSPKMLKVSQSSKYNQFIKGLLAKTEQELVANPFAANLKFSLYDLVREQEISPQDNSIEYVDLKTGENKKLDEVTLDHFKREWDKNYDINMQKRNSMVISANGSEKPVSKGIEFVRYRIKENFNQ